MNDIQRRAAEQIAEIFHFEQWLRFYFIAESQDDPKDLRLMIPEEHLKRIREEQPGLVDLAELANGQKMDMQTSQNIVCAYVGRKLDSGTYPTGTVESVLDSAEFQVEMQLQGLWMQGHEGYLDENFLTFAGWREMYAGWMGMEQVQAARAKMLASKAPAEGEAQGGEGASETVH